MAGKFINKRFADIDLNDPFFDSLKEDYPEFEKWFNKKAIEERKALIFEDENGIAAFVALKNENEKIEKNDGQLPAINRLKICTLKISDRHRGERYGEGAIGLTLWKWQKSGFDEIYVTVFDSHISLISLLQKFGFKKVGYNSNGEGIYIKNKNELDFNNPYKSFPFIKGNFDHAGYLIINDFYHDTMFAYSDLANQTNDLKNKICNSVINGVSKIYIGKAKQQNHFIGEPIYIYRKDTQNKAGTRYRSCLTSFAIVTDIINVKSEGRKLITFEELKKRISNKSVFNEAELKNRYEEDYNVSVIGLIYYGFFGAGNNITMDWLEKNGLFPKSNQGIYPTNMHLTIEQFKFILEKGKINVSNVIVN